MGSWKSISLGLLALSLAVAADAQEHVTLPLDNPLYVVLESAALRGLLPQLPAAKPYTLSAVRRYISSLAGLLSPGEYEIAAGLLDQASRVESGGILRSETSVAGTESRAAAGVDVLSDSRVDLLDPSGWHTNNLARFRLGGDLGPDISYAGKAGVSLDKVGPSAFVPYSFTKNWDGFHIGPYTDRQYSVDGVEPKPYFSLQSESEAAVSLLGNALLLRIGRFRREWGSGDGGLSLSGTARPFTALEAYAQLAPWMSLSFATGSLGNPAEEAKVKPGYPTSPTYQRNLAIQELDVTPTPWLDLSATAAVLYGKRFEISYLDPLSNFAIDQNFFGDFDNVSLEGALSISLSPFGRLYASLFIDELKANSLESLFRDPRNMLAYQVGFKVPIPVLAFSVLTLQYTKIEPFTYAHYTETMYPFSSVPVVMSYTNDGENLGYHLPPNSDELLVSIRTAPLPGLSGTLQYSLVRHGDNPSAPVGATVIQGDVNKPFNYSLAGMYPEKDFLHDGLYDWNSIFSLFGTYRFPVIPVAVSLDYAWSWTTWKANNSGETPPPDQARQILGALVTVFR